MNAWLALVVWLLAFATVAALSMILVALAINEAINVIEKRWRKR